MWLPEAFGDVVDERLGRDPFDPRNWPEYWRGSQTLPLGDSCNAPMIVLDWIDYQWAIRWRWSWTTSKQGRARRHKVYGRRNTGNGAQGTQFWLWLHKEICLRARPGAEPVPHDRGPYRRRYAQLPARQFAMGNPGRKPAQHRKMTN